MVRDLADIGEEAAALAQGWLGTPYRHQASCKGAGADCLGLIRGIWRELYGQEPETPPPYSADWLETTGDETLWLAAKRILRPAETRSLGDVLLFRMGERGPAKHLAVRSQLDPERIIHAYSRRAVVETPLTPGWRRRIVAEFRFPERGL